MSYVERLFYLVREACDKLAVHEIKDVQEQQKVDKVLGALISLRFVGHGGATHLTGVLPDSFGSSLLDPTSESTYRVLTGLPNARADFIHADSADALSKKRVSDYSVSRRTSIKTGGER